ncbi:MAG: DUF2892 domain-containing protein [Bdellovibrionota bacterium]
MVILDVREKEEFAAELGEKSIFPIMRQVHIIAASMVFCAFLAAHFIYPGLIYMALLVGIGLFIFGLTGHCPMAWLLQKMPWNQAGVCCKSEENKGNCCK